MKTSKPCSLPEESCVAFTLVELCAVLAVVLAGSMLLAPALARTKTVSKPCQCQNNLRQLMNAMSMYQQDNHDFFPPNPDDSGPAAGHDWCAGAAGIRQLYEFNPDVLASPSTSPLATYVGSNVSLFHCTADLRVGPYSGADPSKAGTLVRSARSISMNGAVGTVCAAFLAGAGHSGPPNLPAPGSFLTGTHNRNQTTWRTYGKSTDIVNPVPSNLFVLIEEDPLSINDGVLAFSASLPEWVDFPSTLHNLGGAVSFADAHTELHRWVEPTTPVRGHISLQSISATDRDWLWLKARTSALR